MLPEIYPKKEYPKIRVPENLGSGIGLSQLPDLLQRVELDDGRQGGEGAAASPAALACVTGMVAARAEKVDTGEDDGW